MYKEMANIPGLVITAITAPPLEKKAGSQQPAG
jgi:hypothetical protein